MDSLNKGLLKIAPIVPLSYNKDDPKNVNIYPLVYQRNSSNRNKEANIRVVYCVLWCIRISVELVLLQKGYLFFTHIPYPGIPSVIIQSFPYHIRLSPIFNAKIRT